MKVRSADEFGVRDHVRFRTEVTGARWDDARAKWPGAEGTGC